jgi:hypothetical protein
MHDWHGPGTRRFGPNRHQRHLDDEWQKRLTLTAIDGIGMPPGTPAALHRFVEGGVQAHHLRVDQRRDRPDLTQRGAARRHRWNNSRARAHMSMCGCSL